MTYTITSDETGRSFNFPNEDAWERAMDWYNSTEKADIVEFCASHGLQLEEKTSDPYFAGGVKLMSDWADAAMELFASLQADEFSVGDRVEGGDNENDYDIGRVTEISGDEITVAWDSGVRTTQPSSILRPEGSNPHRPD